MDLLEEQGHGDDEGAGAASVAPVSKGRSPASLPTSLRQMGGEDSSPAAQLQLRGWQRQRRGAKPPGARPSARLAPSAPTALATEGATCISCAKKIKR